ncbi:hypothetical protein DF185_18155 [Marinifilum breve]|uniref:Uncharacterized protein n=1 Tax=Marinifilum breve TaxID=2184082 RepID=A0A2V3ZU02_9BACT|nr:hypothetical protein [Marinifilum breve]PXX97891.1 hypothetical protein DF185_18155 [Marinifilum breve]
MKLNFFYILAILALTTSCHDNITDDISTENTNAKTELTILPSIKMSNINNTKNSVSIGNYDIDLSNPPRKVMINGVYSSNFNYWFDTNVASKIPYNIKKDISYNDGWEVIYNTIQEYNPSTHQGTTSFPFVGLYNRYRGIFRFFYYHSLNTQGNDVVGILALANGNNSKVLNQPPIGESYPNNQQQKYISTLGTALSYNVNNIDNGLTPNHWYCFDFDVSCYDPKIQSGGLIFAITSIQRDNLEFSGNISGDITGSIVGSSSSSGSLLSIGNLFAKNDETSSTTNVNLEVNGTNADAVGTTLEDNADSSSAGIDVKNLFKGVVKDGVSALKKGVASFMSSGISGLFSSLSSSLFGSSKPNIQQVKLHTQLDLKGSGTITSKNTIAFDLEMPNKRIGLVHLSSAPSVRCRESIELNKGRLNHDPDNPNSYMVTHSFNTINCNVVVNQDIANEVDVRTTSKLLYIEKSSTIDLLASDPNFGLNDTSVAFTWGEQKLPYRNAQIVGLDKNTEIWNTNLIALPFKIFDKSANKYYQSWKKDFIVSKPLNNVYIKVNYEIIPKNGSETFRLQKTYKANVIEYNTSNPFPRNWDQINSGLGEGPDDPGY